MPSRELLENVTSDNAPDPYLCLLTITHPAMVEPLRFVRDYVALESRSMTFNPFPFDFAPPGQNGNSAANARIVIDNIDKRIVQTVRALPSAPFMLVEFVLASAPDNVEETWPLFRLYAADGDYMQLTGEIVDTQDDDEPLMQWTYSASTAPALSQS